MQEKAPSKRGFWGQVRPQRAYDSSMQGALQAIYLSMSLGKSLAAVSLTRLYFRTASGCWRR